MVRYKLGNNTIHKVNIVKETEQFYVNSKGQRYAKRNTRLYENFDDAFEVLEEQMSNAIIELESAFKDLMDLTEETATETHSMYGGY